MALRWFAERDELHRERGAAGVDVELPERSQRPVGGDRSFVAGEVLLGPPSEDLEEQVVHGAEVVVDELRLQARPGPRLAVT